MSTQLAQKPSATSWWTEQEVVAAFRAYQTRLVESLRSEAEVLARNRDYFDAEIWASAARMIEANPYTRFGSGTK